MKKFIKIIFFLLFVFSLQNSFAWGSKGHALVAEIAKSLMSDNAVKNVQKYLGSTSFEDAANWMDQMRSDPSYDYMKPWHYINLEKDATYVPGDGNNIIDRLNIIYTELQNKDKLTTEQINKDILMLFHLTGDLFQPLHVGYGSDKGGNSYQIDLNGKGTNLHHVWDTEIIEQENITLNDCLEAYKKFDQEEVKYMQKGNFVEWMKQIRSFLDKIYPSGHKIDSAYLSQNRNKVVMLLSFAGIKLASEMDSLFGGEDNRAVSQQSSANSLIQPEKINVEDAAKYEGKKVSVCSMVYGVKELSSVNFINLGAKYPNNPLTVVVFSGDKNNFKNGLGVYDGKNICITGTIKMYKGKPEIIATKPEDITIQ